MRNSLTTILLLFGTFILLLGSAAFACPKGLLETTDPDTYQGWLSVFESEPTESASLEFEAHRIRLENEILWIYARTSEGKEYQKAAISVPAAAGIALIPQGFLLALGDGAVVLLKNMHEINMLNSEQRYALLRSIGETPISISYAIDGMRWVSHPTGDLILILTSRKWIIAYSAETFEEVDRFLPLPKID